METYWRPFLDEVFEKQSDLSDYLTELMEVGTLDGADIPGNSLREKRKNLMETFRRGTMGFGRRTWIRDFKTGWEERLSRALSDLLTYNSPTIKVNVDGMSDPVQVRSARIYGIIRAQLEGSVYDMAIESAVRMAPEREQKGTRYKGPKR